MNLMTVRITRKEFRSLPLETQRRIMAEQAAKMVKRRGHCAHGNPYSRFCMFCECVTHADPIKYGGKVRRA